MRNAKIVCTLGPATEAVEDIEALAGAGMAVARLNASHGTREQRARVIDRVRRIDDRTDRTLATMLDLQGPEIRTASIGEPIELESGTEVRFVRGEDATPEEIGLSVSLAGVEPGDTILLDDGLIEATVIAQGRVGEDGGGPQKGDDNDGILARIDEGGRLGSHRGVNVPGVDLGLDIPTAADRRELDLAVEADVDFVAASFVRDAADVYAVGEAIEDLGADVPVVAKIERADAVAHLDGLVEEADGVMVARGDLGVECPLEQVPLIQKRIIRVCHAAGVPVITATEMLDSMVHDRRPTRAEATDVANAVLDGTDAVMLSAETAIGDHPVRVVETMDRIVRDVEASEEYAQSREQRVPQAGPAQTDALARAARFLARDVGASAVVAATESGYTAQKAAKYRPPMPVVAATPDDRVRRRLALTWGVVPTYTAMVEAGAEAVIHNAVQAALDAGAADRGDTVVVLAGMMTDVEGFDTTNTLKVHVAATVLASGRSVVEGYATGPVHRVPAGDRSDGPAGDRSDGPAGDRSDGPAGDRSDGPAGDLADGPDGDLADGPDGDLADVPEGAILVLPESFEGELTGDLERLAGVIDGRSRVTSHVAMVARELGLPMISDVNLPDDVEDGTAVTVDAERGIVYEETLRHRGEVE